jgi:hypothetical protein
VVSSDGHPIEGEIPFTVTAPDTPSPTPSETVSAAPAETVTAQPAPEQSTPAALDAEETGAEQDDGGVPGWVWIVVFGLAGIGIGMAFSLRKKP